MAEEATAKRRPKAGESAPPLLTSDQIRAQQVFDLYQALPPDMRYEVANAGPRETYARLMKTSRALRAELTRPALYDNVLLRTEYALHNFLLPVAGESTATRRHVREAYIVLDSAERFGPWRGESDYPARYIRGITGTKRLFIVRLRMDPGSSFRRGRITDAILRDTPWANTVEELVLGAAVLKRWAAALAGSPVNFPALRRLHIYINASLKIDDHDIDLSGIQAPNLEYLTSSAGYAASGIAALRDREYAEHCAVANAVITRLNPRILNRYITGTTPEDIIADATRLLQSFPAQTDLSKVALMPWAASLATLDAVLTTAPSPVARAIQTAFREIPWAAWNVTPRRFGGSNDLSTFSSITQSTFDVIRARFVSDPRHVAEYAPLCAQSTYTDSMRAFSDYTTLMFAGSLLARRDAVPRFNLTNAQVDAARFLVRRFPEIQSMILPYLAASVFNNPISPTTPFLPEDIYDVTAEWICAMAPVMVQLEVAWSRFTSERAPPETREIHAYLSTAIGLPLATLRPDGFSIGTNAPIDPARVDEDDGAVPAPGLSLTTWGAAETALRFFIQTWQPTGSINYPRDDSAGAFTVKVATEWTWLLGELIRANVPELIRASRRLARRVWSYLWRRRLAPPTVAILCAILALSETSPTVDALALSYAQEPSYSRDHLIHPIDGLMNRYIANLARNPAFKTFARAHKAAIETCLGKIAALLGSPQIEQWSINYQNGRTGHGTSVSVFNATQDFFTKLFSAPQ